MSKKGSEDSVPATWPPDLALPLEMQFKAAVAEVEGDISKSAREPVIDDDIPLDGLKKEWIDFANILLEFIRHNEEIRRAVINVGTMAVQQTMLKELFSGLIDTELWQEYEDDPLFMQLLALASFGEVPEELLVPDIRNAPELVSTTIKAKNIKDATRLKREKYNEGNREIDADGLVFELFSGGVTDISIYQNMLNSFIERMQYNPGVSKDEKKLTALLLHISRTIKLLSAIATLQESGIQVETSSDGLSRLVLKSGITFITARDKINLQGLIESGTDVKLELVSDRSLKLTTGEKTYFIKERKTPKHLITQSEILPDGTVMHKVSNSSGQEFEHASEMAKKGKKTYLNGKITVETERPIGYVVFPGVDNDDGYQICIYDDHPADITGANTATKNKTTKRILSYINKNRDLFKTEYEQVINSVKPKEVKFEHFAKVKARLLIYITSYWAEIAANSMGFVDEDGYDHSIRIVNENPDKKDQAEGMFKRKRRQDNDHSRQSVIEVVLYDFEYYKRLGIGYTMRNASDIVLQEKGLEEELNKYGWLGKFKDDILYRAIADVMIEDLFINNP